MALTKVSRGLLSTGIVDNSNATAITLNADESVALSNKLSLGTDSGDAFNSSSMIKVQTSGSGYVQLKTSTTSSAGILFGDTDDDFTGGMIYDNNLNTLYFTANNAERMRITSAGLTGIGTSSPSRALSTKSSSVTVANFESTSATAGFISFNDSNTTNDVTVRLGAVGDNLVLQAGGAERIRVDSLGNLLVGTTSTSLYGATSGGGVMLNPNGPTTIARDGNAALYLNRTVSDGKILEFRKNGTQVGSISTNTYSLPSDRNFKRNIQDLSLGLNFISSLEPVTYNYKIDDDGAPIMAGLIAQDVEIALAAAGVEANSMTLLQHNPTEDEKESDYQMDYSKLVPVLINAVKELTERLEQLENN
jgi:hypothetical protein